MMQDDIPDEVLMAYADGELTADEAVELRERLARDEALARRLEVFAGSRGAVQALRRGDAAHGIPPAFEASLRKTIAEARARDAGTANVVPLRRRAVPLWSGALAASLALAVGLVAGLTIGDPRGTMAPADPVLAALDSIPSGDTVTLGDGREIELVSSFRSAEGVLCREYEVTRPDGARSVAVACRDDQTWTPQLVLALGGAEGYAPASAPELLDLFYLQSGAGAPLSPEEERAALEAASD